MTWQVMGTSDGRPTDDDYFHELDVDVNWSEIPGDAVPKIERLVTLVLTVLTAIVDKPEQVKLQVRANHRRMVLTVRVNNDDVGFALGQRGAHADALRTLLIAACKKLRFHFEMDIIGASGEADWSSS